MRSSWTSGKSSSKCDPVCHWLRHKPWPLEDLKFSLMAGCTGIEAIEIALETNRSATAGCQKQHRKWTSVSNLTDTGKLEKCRLGTCLQFCTGNVVVTRALKRHDSTMNYAQQPHANSVCWAHKGFTDTRGTGKFLLQPHPYPSQNSLNCHHSSWCYSTSTQVTRTQV